MVAQDAKYHKKCLSVLHHRVRKAESEGPNYKANEREVSGIVFAELVLYIEEARLDEERAQVFKLSNLVELYPSRMQQLGVKLATRVHSIRLKQRLLAQFSDMRAHTKGRDVLMVFEEDVGLLSPKPVRWTVIMMWSSLHVLHRPCAATSLKKAKGWTEALHVWWI